MTPKSLSYDLPLRLSERLLSLEDAIISAKALDGASPYLRRAGVLVPIINRLPEPTVLLTLRAKTLKAHAGQIAFPGGQVDPGDVNILATALRETGEETGIDPSFIAPIGGLTPVESITGFLMHPIVAVVHPGFTTVSNPREVEAIFEVPLAFLTDAANQIQKSGTFEGVPRTYYSISYDKYEIWGATARILVDLGRRLRMDGDKNIQ